MREHGPVGQALQEIEWPAGIGRAFQGARGIVNKAAPVIAQRARTGVQAAKNITHQAALGVAKATSANTSYKNAMQQVDDIDHRIDNAVSNLQKAVADAMAVIRSREDIKTPPFTTSSITQALNSAVKPVKDALDDFYARTRSSGQMSGPVGGLHTGSAEEKSAMIGAAGRPWRLQQA